jgi:DNA-binding transcriptional LysR family regulator
VVNPEEQSFDMAISGRTASYDGVIDVPLCSTHPVLVAAPAYLKSRPAPPAHPRDLIEHACLVFSPTGRRWSFQSSRGLQSVEVSAHMVADDNLTLLHAATAGMGIAVLPRYVATDAIRSGALECLLPAFPLQDHWFRAYVPKRRLRIARVQALVDWLVQDLTAFSEASAGSRRWRSAGSCARTWAMRAGRGGLGHDHALTPSGSAGQHLAPGVDDTRLWPQVRRPFSCVPPWAAAST